MRNIAIALATAAALLTAPALQAREKLTGEEKLAKILEGREPGKPVNCISLSTSREAQVVDKTAIVYGRGKTVYVNRPSNAESLDGDDIMVIETSLGQICKLDTIRLHDRSQHFFTGFVGLEEFVPYTKVDAKVDKAD